MRDLDARVAGGRPFEPVDRKRRRVLRLRLDQRTHAAGHHLKRRDPPAVPAGLGTGPFLRARPHAPAEDRAAAPRAPHEGVAEVVRRTRGGACLAGHPVIMTPPRIRHAQDRRPQTRGPDRSGHARALAALQLPIPPPPEGDGPLGRI
ncbi:hypothetical protein [Sinosporangium album]|uniref:hypothetical protein n=1 Tax=Sinosporangium album TaxID=504805 RepID=UPI0015A144AB|nr:hypothetical protein [Sinosporangium album]